MRSVTLGVVVVALVGCRELALSPPPTAGSIRATVVTSTPNRAELVPAAGAKVRLLDTSLEATADSDGNFVLSNITTDHGRVLITFDANGDGVADRSRLISLETVKAGFGRDVNLGQLSLGRNGSVVGVVKKSDRAALSSGHAGITVFLPQLPQVGFTGDDGSFIIGGVPEGEVVVGFFAPGYQPESTTVTMQSGAEVKLSQVVLEADPGSMPLGTLTGLVNVADNTPLAGVDVRVAASGTESSASTNAEGRFTFSTLNAGVYSLALEKQGFASVRADGVLVANTVKQVGPYVMVPGTSTITALDGGPGRPDAGNIDAGNTDAGSTDAGNTDAGSTDAGNTDAGNTDAGNTDAGSTDAGNTDAGNTDAGTRDGGTADGGGLDAGLADAGPVLPVAVVGPAQVVASQARVTLNGTLSTGDQPLTYQWTQVAGPPVTVAPNGTATAHSAQFTASDAGTVLEFSLVVTDRFNRSSTNTAVTRVAVGGTPIARFTPDSGVVFGGQRLVLQANTVDDAGLLLTQFDWALVSGADAGVLISDGGSSALFTLPARAQTDPDLLTGVELRVTNSIGAVSAPTRQFYTVRGTSTSNWTLDAGPNQVVPVPVVTPTVVLSASTSTTVTGAQVRYAWSCSPSMPLLNADQPTARFAAPVVVGPNVTVTCVVTATGDAPLEPPSLSSSVIVVLQDRAPPTLVGTNVQNTRTPRFGFWLRANEPLSDSTAVSASCGGTGWNGFAYGNTFVTGTYYTPLSPVGIGGALSFNTCGSMSVVLTDTEGNSSASIPFGPGISTPVIDAWSGIYESVQAFDDPRPIIATLGPDQAGPSQGFEILVDEGGTLARVNGLDLTATLPCSPSCPLTTTSLGLPVERNLDPGQRVFTSGAELFVITGNDGGVAPAMARRSAAGTWSSFNGVTGTPGSWLTQLRTVRVDGTGQVLMDQFDPVLGFTTTDSVASGLSQVSLLATNARYVAAVTGTTKQLVVRFRNATTQAWSTRALTSIAAATTGVTAIQLSYMTESPNAPDVDGLMNAATIQTPSGLLFHTLDQVGFRTFDPGQVTGFDVATWGENVYAAFGLAGDLRLRTMHPGWWGSGHGGPYEFGGPPRVGFTAPYPLVLDNNPICEAAWPRLAFIDGALVIVWQERCSPETRWKVYARVIR